MFATVIVNESVTLSPAASVIVRTTAFPVVPTLALVGVPVSTPVLAVNVSHLEL